MEVLNFWSNENQNFRLCVTVLLDRCQIFGNRTPLAVVFLPLESKQFLWTLFEVFFQPLKFFQVREFLKAARRAAGKQTFRGLYLPCFLETVLDSLQVWCVLQDTSLDLFLDFSIFLSSHTRRTRWENWPDERKLVRCDSSLIKEVSSETGDDYCLSAVVPLPGYLIFSSSSKIWRNR